MTLRDISVRTVISLVLFIIFAVSLIPLFFVIKGSMPDAVTAYYFIPPFLFICFISMHLYLTRYLVSPIGRIQGALNEITSGKIDTPIALFGMNCAGRLIPLIQNMQKSLIGTVENIRSVSGTIFRGAEDIASVSNDLSGRTERQAASLEETAASMEQLTVTVQQNADNAHKAVQSAEEAVATARKGYQVIGDMSATMNAIAESARKISDITNVIESIAFQTNILALNAAVEAARAGEQGRGFSVVAGEVRNLAQRCAISAKDIAVLIEESANRTTKGSALSVSAAQTMEAVMASVSSVTELVNGISLASEEQSRGIMQINQAVSELDTTTQQNASLAEKTASSAASLMTQAESLANAIAEFRTGQEAVLYKPVRQISNKLQAGAEARVQEKGWQYF